MTIPIKLRPAAATALEVPIGPQVLDLLDVAYRARRPLLLEGQTGIGKSQIVSEFAQASGLSLVILDLSLLEPPDLVGLPVIREGRTHYASPSELPAGGRGILLLEELNRAEIPVMQPALQLLSARRLHAYELPAGWTCVAAVNPEDGDYQVNRLDPALRSRFLQLSVCADRDSWLAWATRSNVHPLVLRIVRDHVDAFDQASPRSWSYASELLHVLTPEELARPDLVRVALRGYLPTAWALLAAEALSNYPQAPHVDLERLLSEGGASLLADQVQQLTLTKRPDAVAMLAAKLRREFRRSDALRLGAEAGTLSLDSLEGLLASLPGDLREQCLDSAVESSAAAALFRPGRAEVGEWIRAYEGSAVQEEIRECRRGLKVHRVRLAVVNLLRWLEESQGSPGAPALPPEVAEGLALLVVDAGPMAQDLARWVRAQDQAP